MTRVVEPMIDLHQALLPPLFDPPPSSSFILFVIAGGIDCREGTLEPHGMLPLPSARQSAGRRGARQPGAKPRISRRKAKQLS